MSGNQTATQNVNEFDIASRISKILDEYDKPMRKKVLNLLATRENCRLTPIGVPIGSITTASRSNKKETAKSPAIARGKAPWKNDARWTTIVDEHAQLKASLKAIAPGGDTTAALAALRDCEARQKALKAQLRNSGSSGGNSQSQ